VFVANATIPRCDLDASIKIKPWNCFMFETRNSNNELRNLVGLAAIRTILTDDVLAAALLWELWQRGINRSYEDNPLRRCSDGLVLIVEDGSAYSAALARSLGVGFSSNCGGPLVRPLVRTYGYHRLLDSGRAYINSSRKEDSAKSEALNWQLDTGSIDRAEGISQYDYLKRLGDEIAVLDSNPAFAISGVKAIGIVGSDVYDKLLILQALRTRFKNKIFFTTDLDARYLYASQKKWTRNLVIATSFDLSLNPVLQRSTIPFRDGYQTATYLAALMALEQRPLDYWNGKLKDWLRPQIFEIGRTEAVHLASPSISDLTSWIKSRYSDGSATPAAYTKCDDYWAVCKNIEPNRAPQGIGFADLLVISILILIGGLAIALSPRVQKASRDAYDALTSSTPADARVARIWLVTVLVLVGAVLATVVLVHRAMDESFAQGAGEPFLWLEGISVWPIIILRFVGLVVMIFLVIIFTIWIQHQANLISKNFDLPKPQTWKLARPRWSASLIGPHLDLASFGPDGNFNPKPADEGVEITSLWQNYLRATCWREMWWRVLISMLLMFLLGFGFFYFFDTPSFPHRGPLVGTLYGWLAFPNVMLLWLVIFWVGYETRACARFVTIVSDVRSVWPKSLLDREEVKTGIPREHLDDYLDFQITVSATRRIHLLIYLPFVLLLFLVLSHSPLFDAMDLPSGQVFIIGSAFAYALYTAVFLRRRAEAARAKTLENYNSQLLVQLGPKNSQRTDAAHQGATNSPLVSPDQIKLLMERIRGTREGAFAPFSQQPAVQALLLPFGGYGGVQLIEYLINF
jgi:hypothetical protein